VVTVPPKHPSLSTAVLPQALVTSVLHHSMVRESPQALSVSADNVFKLAQLAQHASSHIMWLCKTRCFAKNIGWL
jgi:hypothetical protein